MPKSMPLVSSLFFQETATRKSKHVSPAALYNPVLGGFSNNEKKSVLKNKTLVISNNMIFINHNLNYVPEVTADEISAKAKELYPENESSSFNISQKRTAQEAIISEKSANKIFDHLAKLFDQGIPILFRNKPRSSNPFTSYKDLEREARKAAGERNISEKDESTFIRSYIFDRVRPLIDYYAKEEKSSDRILYGRSFDEKDYEIVATNYQLSQDDLLVLERQTALNKHLIMGEFFENDNEKESPTAAPKSQIPTLQNDPEKAIERSMRNKFSVKDLTNDEETFIAQVTSSTASNILVQPYLKGEEKNSETTIAEDTKKAADEHAFRLMKAVKNERPAFYLDSFEQIYLGHDSVNIDRNGSVKDTKDGPLFSFLEQHNKQNPKPLLIINWDNFDAKQKLSLNTLLDITRKVGGVTLNDSVQIVSLSRNSDDISFVSRHESSIISKLPPQPKEQAVENPKKIDLQGNFDWRSQLFGRVVLKNNEMVWEKSDFVNTLENPRSANINFEIINLPVDARKEFQRELDQAQATGKFIYHGYEIGVEGVAISLSEKELDFTQFSTDISIKSNSTLEDDKSRHLINANVFGFLLQNKEIKDGKYSETKGLLAEAHDATLKLFISSDLAENQWYQLFNEAKNKNVTLDIHLAEGVTLPDSLGVTSEEYQSTTKKLTPAARICVSDDAAKTAAELREKDTYAVIDIEDLTAQDLVGEIKFDKDSNKFTKHPGLLNGLLKPNEKIILKGKFSPELWQMIEPTLIEAGSNITLIIEDREYIENNVKNEVFSATTPCPSLKWLEASSYQVKVEKQYGASATSGNQTPVSPKEYKPEAGENALENAAYHSEKFLETRTKNFSDLLATSQMMQLTGHSGVGKSSLIKTFEDDHKDTHTIHRELTNLKKWATSNDGKTQVLFIDESNIESSHLTAFSPLKDLKKGETAQIFYQGEFLEVTGGKHQVIFACNSKNYGGGRLEQKLFEDGSIKTMNLSDFPDYYIYDELLKKAIYDQSPEIQSRFRENEFNEFCAPLVKEYVKTPEERYAEKIYSVLDRCYTKEGLEDLLIAHYNKDKTQSFSKIKKQFIQDLGADIKNTDENGMLPVNNHNAINIFETLNIKVLIDVMKESYETDVWRYASNYFGLGEGLRLSNISAGILDLMKDYNSERTSGKIETGADTVRELQQTVLKEVNKALKIKSEKTKLKTSNFISTNATQEVEEALEEALDIKALQRNSKEGSRAIGLNGVLLEGPSGVGKSELISAMLEHKGITERNPSDSGGIENQQYYKIDASLDTAAKKAIISKAFEEGNIVWIDEINSCLEDGLEKFLNLALTGEHPDPTEETKNMKIKPGFMLISSVNSINLEGRSPISPALRHRTIQPRVKSLQEYEAKDVQDITQHWLNDESIHHDIIEKLKEQLTSYKGNSTVDLKGEGKSAEDRVSALEKRLQDYKEIVRPINEEFTDLYLSRLEQEAIIERLQGSYDNQSEFNERRRVHLLESYITFCCDVSKSDRATLIKSCKNYSAEDVIKALQCYESEGHVQCLINAEESFITQEMQRSGLDSSLRLDTKEKFLRKYLDERGIGEFCLEGSFFWSKAAEQINGKNLPEKERHKAINDKARSLYEEELKGFDAKHSSNTLDPRFVEAVSNRLGENIKRQCGDLKNDGDKNFQNFRLLRANLPELVSHYYSIYYDSDNVQAQAEQPQGDVSAKVNKQGGQQSVQPTVVPTIPVASYTFRKYIVSPTHVHSVPIDPTIDAASSTSGNYTVTPTQVPVFTPTNVPVSALPTPKPKSLASTVTAPKKNGEEMEPATIKLTVKEIAEGLSKKPSPETYVLGATNVNTGEVVYAVSATLFKRELLESEKGHEWRQKEVNAGRNNNLKIVGSSYENGRSIDDMLMRVIIATAGNMDKTNDLNAQLAKALKVIEFAKSNGGAGSKAATQKLGEVSDLLPEEKKWYKEFSKNFQINCKKCGIFSGRGESSVGLRTAYVPESVLNDLKRVGMEKLITSTPNLVEECNKTIETKSAEVIRSISSQR